MRGFLSTGPEKIVTGLMLACIAVYAAYPKTERIPLAAPLKAIPISLGDWRMVNETPIEDQVLEVLKADDTLSRNYVGPGNQGAHLLVVFFKSQSTGVAPHSPKNCLPGSGWMRIQSGEVEITIPGTGERIEVNKYIVAKGPAKSVVLYWYQSAHRVVASEYWAKLYTIADSVRYRRSDTSMVRVVVPVRSESEAQGVETAVGFVQAAYPVLRSYLPR